MKNSKNSKNLIEENEWTIEFRGIINLQFRFIWASEGTDTASVGRVAGGDAGERPRRAEPRLEAGVGLGPL